MSESREPRLRYTHWRNGFWCHATSSVFLRALGLLVLSSSLLAGVHLWPLKAWHTVLLGLSSASQVIPWQPDISATSERTELLEKARASLNSPQVRNQGYLAQRRPLAEKGLNGAWKGGFRLKNWILNFTMLFNVATRRSSLHEHIRSYYPLILQVRCWG